MAHREILTRPEVLNFFYFFRPLVVSSKEPLLSLAYKLIYLSLFSQCQVNCGRIPTLILVFSSVLLSNSSIRKVPESFLLEE